LLWKEQLRVWYTKVTYMYMYVCMYVQFTYNSHIRFLELGYWLSWHTICSAWQDMATNLNWMSLCITILKSLLSVLVHPYMCMSCNGHDMLDDPWYCLTNHGIQTYQAVTWLEKYVHVTTRNLILPPNLYAYRTCICATTIGNMHRRASYYPTHACAARGKVIEMAVIYLSVFGTKTTRSHDLHVDIWATSKHKYSIETEKNALNPLVRPTGVPFSPSCTVTQ
jgi:hypothetical protein